MEDAIGKDVYTGKLELLSEPDSKKMTYAYG